ncbi:MAG TPA: rhodanese-like domain-containing protein [Burkholderiales bacterium]|nr:rhodanese-like domain-containing protein [Burkholderiales bacterium]
MKKLPRYILIILSLVLAPASLAEPPELNNPEKLDLSQRQSLSPQEAAALRNENVIYLDVRSTLEWLGGHVEGAIHLPYDKVAQDIGSVLPDRSVPVITYCVSGARAAFVIDAMRKQGYTVVPVTNGGYRELIANGMKKD